MVWVLSLYIISMLFIIFFIRVYRGNSSHVHHMVMTMSLSMTFGFTLGIIIGIQFQGYFFFSTLSSIIFTGLIGAFIGYFFSPLASVEGIFNGAMAGMMGTMIAEMLTITYGQKLLFVSFLFIILSITFCLRCFIITYNSRDKRMFSLLYVCTCLWILLVFLTFLPLELKDKNPSPLNHVSENK